MKGALTIAQAAKCVPLSEPQLRSMIGRQELDVVRIGRRIFIPEAVLRTKFGLLMGIA